MCYLVSCCCHQCENITNDENKTSNKRHTVLHIHSNYEYSTPTKQKKTWWIWNNEWLFDTSCSQSLHLFLMPMPHTNPQKSPQGEVSTVFYGVQTKCRQRHTPWTLSTGFAPLSSHSSEPCCRCDAISKKTETHKRNEKPTHRIHRIHETDIIHLHLRLFFYCKCKGFLKEV